MKTAAGLALVLALAGCGGTRTVTVTRAAARSSFAFEVIWPHGSTESETPARVPGRVIGVEIGGVRLARDRWTCLRRDVAARYRLRGGTLVVGLNDDARGICAGEPERHVQIVGGFARGGGYVGEWSPAAVTYH